MSEFFKAPGDVQLDELTNATLMKLEQFRDRTATGQLHVQFNSREFNSDPNYLMRKC